MPRRILPCAEHDACHLPGCAAVRALFWISTALLAWAQVGYGVFLELLNRLGTRHDKIPAPSAGVPRVSLIVAAYREQDVIAEKVANALALDWPRGALE